MRESAAHFISLESKTLRTLAAVVLAPGRLTAEYLAGRRAGYVRPLRLYLWTSVVVIATMESFGLHLSLRFSAQQGIHLFESPQHPPTAGELRPMQFILDHFDTPRLRRFKAMPVEEQSKLVQRERHRYVRYFLLFLVPVFALVLKLCYPNRSYADHLVFYLHAQSFLLLMLLIEAKLPGIVAPAVTIWVIAYFILALKRVYGGTWVGTLVRGTAAVVLDVASFLVTGALLVYASLAT